MIQYKIQSDNIWIRIFGYGISIRNVKTLPLLFSERNGLVKYFKVGNWVIIFLGSDCGNLHGAYNDLVHKSNVLMRALVAFQETLKDAPAQVKNDFVPVQKALERIGA